MPSRRTRKRTVRAEESAEQAAASEAVPDAAVSSEGKSPEKKKKSTKKETKQTTTTTTSTGPSSTALWEAILPKSLTNDPASLLAHLLVDIQFLSLSKKRCTEALRALKDGKCASPLDEDEGEAQEGKKEKEVRGKKRTRSADKKKKGAISFDPEGEDNNNEEETQGIRDGHLLMATTQSINVLIGYLQSCNEGDGEGAKQTALVLAALSHHLITALVNDKSLLESITKSSQYSQYASSSFAAAASASAWGDHDEDNETGRGRKTETEAQQKLERKRKSIVSYAKAVAGRAMTSCVVGALNAMETLGELELDDEENKMEYTLLRRGVWTCLLGLETAFQMNHRPKLLVSSSVGVSSLGSASSSGMASSYSAGMDFDGMMSAVMGSPVGGSGGSSSTTWMQTHTMMGGNTVAMWNGLVQRIMMDCKLGFHLQNNESVGGDLEEENKVLSEICREITENAFVDEEDSRFIMIVLQSRHGLSGPGSIHPKEDEEPPTKKTKRAPKAKKPTKTESPEHPLSEPSMLLAQRPENHIMFDVHVSVRRWPTLAFGWLCSGQPRLLEVCMNMLTKKEAWKKVLEMDPVESPSAVIADTAKPSSSKKKKKDSKTKRTSLSSDLAVSPANERLGAMQGDLALVIFISCMIDMISTGGISPANSGWIDEYVKSITNMPDTGGFASASEVTTLTFEKKDDAAHDEHPVRRSARTRSKAGAAKTAEKASSPVHSTSPKGGKKSGTTWVRQNITDEVAFLTKLLIEAHTSCLHNSYRDHLLRSETLKNDTETRQLLVNDDDSYRDSSLSYRRHDSKELVNIIPFYPFMHRTLETLGLMASSSSFVQTSVTKSRIVAIGGAIALSHFGYQFGRILENEGEVVVLDAKLISLAVSQLSEAFNCLTKRNISTNSEGVDTSEEIDLKSFVEKYRLNESLNISRQEKKDSELDPRAIDAAISFGGAFIPSNAKEESNESGIQREFLLQRDPAVHAEIISFFIRAQMDESLSEDAHLIKMESFLKSLLFVIRMCYGFPTDQTSDTKTKKKKRKAADASSTGISPQSTSKTMTRCVLSSDVLNFLRACLTTRDTSLLLNGADLLCMSSLFRKQEVFSTKLIKDFVDLGYILQDKLISPRLQIMGDKTSFTPEERRLWSSHIKLSLTIGRGQASVVQHSPASVNDLLLHDCDRRLEVLQHIAKVDLERQHIRARPSENYWPLCLPALQHALIASALSCLPPQPESPIEPELFLCNAFLNSLEIVLGGPKTRSDSTARESSPTDDIPISLPDARLFTLAATKLKKHQQKAVFLRLVELLQMELVALMEIVSHNIQKIRLLARGICLAAHMADIVTTSGLAAHLSREVAASRYSMPKFSKKTTPELERTCCDKSAVFMGLFDDFNSPSVPATAVTISLELLSDVELDKMTALIKSSLKLGFEVASIDGGHLVFSSWNAAAKICSWTPVCWEGPSTAATIRKQDILERLISMRDEMCEVHHLFKNEPISHQQTLLERTTSSKRGRCRPNEALLSGITSSEQIIKRVASDLNSTTLSDDAEVPSLPSFAYYEALPVYLSVLISMHSRPGTNNFSSIHRFSKSQLKRNKPASGYTDEDVLDEFQSDESEFESFESGGQSLRTRALGRLHNACASLGAAPCWPDWLDTSCRMQTDIVPSVAVDSADSALSSLTNLGVVIYKCYCQALEAALEIANDCSPGESSPIPSRLLHQLLVCHQQSSSGCEPFYSYLSMLSQTDTSVLRSVMGDRDSLPNNKFAAHSAQRIKGADATVVNDPTIAELRANEQWEMILSEVIRGSTLQKLTISSTKPDLKKALENVSHWKRVLYSIVSAMVPTAALLRFALYDGKGRSPHPLCNDLPESALSSEAIVTSRFSTKNEVGANINKALAFLSCVSAFSANSDPLRHTSQAAANHMIENSSQLHFNDMVILQAIRVRFDALQGVFEAIKDKSMTQPMAAAAFAVINIIVQQISTSRSNALLSSFGLAGILQARLIGGDKAQVELMSIISSEPACYPEHRDTVHIVKLLLILLAHKEQSPQGMRSMIVQTLCILIDHEGQLLDGGKSTSGTCSLRLTAATALDEMTDDEILLLLGIVVCPSTSSATYESEIAKDLVKLLMSLVTTQHESLSGKGSKTILNNLTESINQWASSPAQSLLTNLICILALRFGTLPTLISKVVSLVVSENSNQNLNDCIQSMFLFVATLRNTVHCEVDDSALEATAQLNREGNSGPRKGIQRRTCTFTQTGEGFAEQHWYNCYTCGLLKDKGCCSLCARVCHKDHDVGYSRKSSFFCDCGAEVASGARVKCKCLSPIDEATFNSLHNESVLAEEPKQLDCGNPVQMVYHSYPAECLSTLDLLAKEAKVSKWNETMLSLFNHSFTNDSIDFNISYLIEDTPAISTIETGKPGLEIRCGLPLNLKLLDGNQSMLPVRAAKANSLKMGMISSSSAIHMRRNRAGRQLIDSDTRGRMVCAEANSILFFSAIPSVNTRHLDTSYAMHLSRSQLSFLGTEKVKFDVLGLALSENQNLLAFWGGSEACVAVLSKGFDAIERTVTLALQIESDSGECESEYLVGLLWLTETIIVGICGTVVHVFDLATTDSEDSCKGTAHFALAYEDVLIRSAVLTSNLSPSHSKEVYKKLVMLLDTGRIHSIDLCVDHDGALEEEGETYIEIGSGITFASAGIRRYYGGEPGSAGSTSTTFGEGATLHFLQHSNLLLYQCVSSPVVAMLIDKNGTINGTFELLPSTISSDNLPGCNFGVLTGPYVHFQELGTVRRDGEVFFRVSCVARVPSSNQQRILLLEFNQSSSVSVKELCWPPSFSAGLGTFSASNSFVGSCTFSVPHLVGGLSSQGSIDGNTEVHERAFLTMLSSNGSILWFGEDMDPSKQAEPPIAENASASNNIFMFEEPSIMNVSEEDWLIFAGDCAGKDFKTIKKKLSLNNSEFLTSPSREGCTLTARLDSGIAKKSGKTNVEDLAIVTVRVLVGGVPELIPREISIMGTGRTIKTKRNLWRWYDFVLTDEEILLAVRNGFVTIHFSSSHDMTSGAAVDAVEIYAKKRSEIPCLTSKSNSAPASDCNFKWQRNNKQGEQNQVSCIKSLTALAKILGEDKASLFGTGSREVIRQILEKTALDTCDDESTESLRTSTLSLLKQVEDSESQRSLFIDHSTLRGLMSTLLNLGKFIKSEVSTIGVGTAFSKQESMIRRAVDLLVHIVNNSSNIARANGNNYKDAILSMMNDGVSTTSLAIEAKRILDFTTHLSLVYGSTINFVKSTYHISQLILMEMSCADSNSFAQFDTLSEYLLHDDSSIVESCCKAIMSTCTDASKPKVPAVDKLTQDNPNNGYVTYQCDACKMFPIKDKRYTIGGEVDIDLCQDCFERGCTYATSHEPGSPLIIHGRTLTVEDEDMPCDSIWQMKCIAIAAPTAGFPMVEDVEVALKMSQTTKEHASNNQGADKDEFRSSLFSNLLALVSKSLAKSSTPSPHLIHLVLGLVHGSKNEKSRIAKGKEMLKSITGSLQDLLQADNVKAGKIVLVLRTISSLVTKKTTIEPSPSSALVKSIPKDKEGKGHQHKSKADPRFICDTHKVPAVRRRCSHGVHKDRRFYVCGLERKHRCNYFKWADSPDNRPEVEDHLSKFCSNNQNISEPLQIELTTILSSFQLQFCTLIGQQFELLKDTSPDDSGDTNIVTERPNFFLRSNDEINQDLNDGILESRIKLGKVETRSATSSSCSSAETSSNGIASLISESLYLLTLVASPPKWGQDWYPVLCAIITGGSSVLRHLAKKFLQKLCGGRQEVYHRIRDHFVYGYLFRKLLCQSEEVLDNALIVREMAKQCGVSWRDDEVEFKTLHPAGLFGVGDLISEDCLSVSYERTVQQILDELLSTAGTNARRCNWKNFCALSEIPPDNKTSTLSHGDTNILEQLVHRPPIMSILWLSSCLRGSNQVKMLKLADIALMEIKKEDHSSSTDEDDAKIGDESNNESLQMTPERTLSALGIGDVHAFIVEFVVHGKSKEVRLVAGQVAAKLATPFTDSDKNALVSRLIDGLLRHVAEKFGCVSQELIELLRHYVKSFNLDLSNIASCISSAFVLQMKTANDCITRSASSASSADIKFDLANCVHCHRQATATKETEVWNDEQLRPCVKTRLESSTLSSASSEYSSYVQLKFRVVLSEVHLTVSDPRGRLVKSIGIYFSPRPFEDVSMLKNDKYSNIWQRCGTLSLARHATSASFKLKSPVVAANLKFTYEEFYEKVGGGSSRASDGSFILHCPRCTRQVNNAHGVCGNCGEVAFQCRKCRHINYDRLDAFLCVECGYCTSGGFSYDISVGMALNAVAILDEDGYQRSVSMLRIASKRHSELRNSLKKKVLASSQQQSKLNGQDECIEEMVLYGPHLNRAFMGRLPKMNDESESKPPSSQPGSSTARQGDSTRSLASNRARSLISLARQLRSESAGVSGDGERLSRSELLQQVLLSTGNSGLSSDVLDELNETMFGALGGSSTDHSLNRAIACLQDRNQPRTSREIGGASGEDAARAAAKDDKKSTPMGESSRIYSQMREAERECYELTRRIEAWNRLNEDALATLGSRNPFRSSFVFRPTSCSNCSPQIALSLLSLLSTVYETSISQSESTVTPELIKLLVSESVGMNAELKNMKRQLLITLASTSEYASNFILAKLKAMQDVTSAELLGQIIQLDFPSCGDYIDFAVSVLQGSEN